MEACIRHVTTIEKRTHGCMLDTNTSGHRHTGKPDCRWRGQRQVVAARIARIARAGTFLASTTSATSTTCITGQSNRAPVTSITPWPEHQSTTSTTCITGQSTRAPLASVAPYASLARAPEHQ
eukprot:1150326-Pelagomonas_calceolata.AAC.3